MNKLQKIICIGVTVLGLASCMPPKLEYSGNIEGEQVAYFEHLIYDGDFCTYDGFSQYEIDITKKDGTQIKYFCRSSKGELILFEKQINNGETTRTYNRGEVLHTNEIKSGQSEVNNYINKIREFK
ncbi:MAG: hypothetical protein AABX99_00545 [Nanoarchaeota archaeon]